MSREKLLLLCGFIDAVFLCVASMFLGPKLVGIGHSYGSALICGFIGTILGFGLGYGIAAVINFFITKRPMSERPSTSGPLLHFLRFYCFLVCIAFIYIGIAPTLEARNCLKTYYGFAAVFMVGIFVSILHLIATIFNDLSKKEVRMVYGITGSTILGVIFLSFGHKIIDFGCHYWNAIFYAPTGAILGFIHGYLIGCLFTMGSVREELPFKPLPVPPEEEGG